jgi:lysophospholipase L1-like esterase
MVRFALALLVLWTTAAHAGEPALAAPASGRWADTFRDFAAMDQAKPPPHGAVVFIGSSSVRLWQNLEGQFGSARVLKRGFGGARLSDCIQHLEQLVVKYEPRLILLYAGDNDLAEGVPPREVLRRFALLTERIQERLPATRLVFISIKPSPARQALLPQVRVANRLIASYVRGRPGLAYVDVFDAMLDDGGLPRSELFGPDGLHLNADGYALWRSILMPLLVKYPGNEADDEQRPAEDPDLGPDRQLLGAVAEHAQGN